MSHYIYRSVADKLGGHLDGIEAAGDQIVSVHYVGGRDWVVVCRTGPADNVDRVVHEYLSRLSAKAEAAITDISSRVRRHVDRIAEQAESAVAGGGKA